MLTPQRVKRLIRLAKVVGPTVVPLLAPHALRAAGALRDRMDRMRARRLGVSAGELPQYSGHGARLHARITGAATTLDELGQRQPERIGFVESGQRTLATLAAAVRAAEHMPANRRRAAHRAVSAELGRIEGDLLRHLGVAPRRRS